jgi:predicted O-linked N-acetylglucosamine transferase (SPINDLY family)
VSSIAKNQQVLALCAQGKGQQALAIARRMVQAAGNRPDAPAFDAMRAALIATGQTEQAAHFAERAVAADAASVPLRLELARVYSLSGRVKDEARVLEEVLALQPDEPSTYAFLASAYERLNLLDQAESVARRGFDRFPTEHAIIVRLGSALAALGRTADAVAIYQKGLASFTNDIEMALCIARTAQYEFPAVPARIRAVHENVGRLIELLDPRPPIAHDRPAQTPPPEGPARPLRIGFLSPDLRSHSVAYFARALIRGADPGLITPFAYMTGFSLDNLSADIKAGAEAAGGAFRHVVDQPDDAILRRILDDQIDVLVELSGLTRDHRLTLLRRKPAPVQITWCGYPSTTGLRLIDYRIVDSITDPPGAERWMVERPLRLDPCFTCYTPPAEAPEPLPPPSARGEPFTFGSFNMLQKVNDEVLRVWARVLNAVPGSRLVIKAMILSHESVRDMLRRRLLDTGHDLDRVTLLPPEADTRHHLAVYHRVDAALDTFPYAGTTTTCEALWMGVPVITLATPQGLHAQRVGASLLTAAGRPEWIASTADEFVAKAAALAADTPGLAHTRATLRAQLAASTLCDARAFAARFQAAARRAWAAWARGEQGQPTEQKRSGPTDLPVGPQEERV